MTALMTLNQHKIEIYIIIASLKSETMGKQIRFMTLDIKFTHSALRTHVESLGKPRDVNKRSRSLAW